MAQGHELDVDTFSLWRLDEVVHGDYVNAAEENGNYDAVQNTNANKPLIIGGAANPETNLARWFDGSGDFLGFTVDAALLAALVDDFTIEAWVFFDSLSNNNPFFTVGGSGELETQNAIVEWKVQSDGNQRVFWENAGGSNREALQASGTKVVAGQWQYVAITGTVSGGSRTVEFFVGSGTPEDSDADVNASGGSLADGAIGSNNSGSSTAAVSFSQLRISDVVRSGTELNDNASDANREFANDANAIALWKFDEAPAALDIGPNGIHLGPFDFNVIPRISAPLLDGTPAGRVMELGTEGLIYKPKGRGLPALLIGDWTFEAWTRPAGAYATRYLFEYPGSGELEADNHLARIELNLSAVDFTLSTFWEKDAGDNVDGTGVVSIVQSNGEAPTLADDRHHIAVVHEGIGGSQRNVLIYRDAVLVETIGPLDLPTGGEDTIGMTLGIITGAGAANMVMQDVRISDKARSLSEIQASVARGTAAGGTTVREKPLLIRTLP